MSVPVGKRTESKLEVQTRAKELAWYTVSICGNEKVFPKRDRWAITNRIVGTALTIMEEHYVQKIDGNGATQERVC